MTGRGFIHDELELKALILYIAARLAEPVPFDTLLDLTMCDDAIGYFDFSQCLAYLVRTEHLTQGEDGRYAITEKGRENGVICETSLPYSVRLRCDRNLSECNRRLRRKDQVQASSVRRENGTYTVTLSLADDMGGLMHLELMVVRKEMAEQLKKRFLAAPEKLYGDVMQTLLAEAADGQEP